MLAHKSFGIPPRGMNKDTRVRGLVKEKHSVLDHFCWGDKAIGQQLGGCCDDLLLLIFAPLLATNKKPPTKLAGGFLLVLAAGKRA